MLHLRPNTTDLMAFVEVVIENEYRLPHRLDGVRVLDIGAHIGTFALACLIRGAHSVRAYESDPSNFRVLNHSDMEPYHVSRVQGAVWRSDRPENEILVGPHTESHNPAANGAFVKEPTTSVPAFSLDDVIFRQGPFDLMKLDCEGSEYPILLTSELLFEIPAICGEWHTVPPERSRDLDLGEWSPYRLRDHLTNLGYSCRFVMQRDFPFQGLFWAVKEGAITFRHQRRTR